MAAWVPLRLQGRPQPGLNLFPTPPIVSYRSPHSWKHHLESKINFAARSGRATRWPLPGGGRLTPREQRCPLPPSTPEALGAPVKQTEKKKNTTQKAQGVGGEGKRQLRVGLGTPPSCQEAPQQRAAAPRRGKGGGQAGRAVGTPQAVGLTGQPLVWGRHGGGQREAMLPPTSPPGDGGGGSGRLGCPSWRYQKARRGGPTPGTVLLRGLLRGPVVPRDGGSAAG